jgi:signal transduction histidine kinase
VAAPWLVWIGRGCRPPGVAAPLVLLPHAPVAVVDAVTADGMVGFAPQFLLYLCLLRLVGCVFAPQRQATLVIAATYLVIVVRGAVSPEPAATLPPWTLALTFAVAAVVGVRAGALSFARAQQAAAERSALDERQRIARDVHDVVADTLAATVRHVAAARRAVDRAAVDEAVAALEAAEHEGRASLGDIRRTLHLLRSDGDAPPCAEVVP